MNKIDLEIQKLEEEVAELSAAAPAAPDNYFRLKYQHQADIRKIKALTEITDVYLCLVLIGAVTVIWWVAVMGGLMGWVSLETAAIITTLVLSFVVIVVIFAIGVLGIDKVRQVWVSHKQQQYRDDLADIVASRRREGSRG